jgi:peptidoglycan/LPS O-acetylase OafA/YrhL
VAEKIALYSYGTYLLYVFSLYLVFMVYRTNNLALGSSLCFGATIMAFFLTCHFLESPLIDLGRRLISRPSGRPVALPAQEISVGS